MVNDANDGRDSIRFIKPFKNRVKVIKILFSISDNGPLVIAYTNMQRGDENVV